MTPAEAQRFLNCEDAEERDDAWEMAVFETRQFLLTKPVLLKTFQSKLQRLKKTQEAFLVLGGKESETTNLSAVDFEAGETISEQFNKYHAAKNALKQQLANASTFEALDTLVTFLIELERKFVEPFSAYTGWTEEEALAGKEPDAMQLLSLLREQAEAGRVTLPELYKNRNKLPAALARELKRLSLHKNYLYE